MRLESNLWRKGSKMIIPALLFVHSSRTTSKYSQSSGLGFLVILLLFSLELMLADVFLCAFPIFSEKYLLLPPFKGYYLSSFPLRRALTVKPTSVFMRSGIHNTHYTLRTPLEETMQEPFFFNSRDVCDVFTHFI